MSRTLQGRPRAALLPLLLSLPAAIGPVRAAEAPTEPAPSLHAEVRQIGASLREIAGLLREHLRHQKGDLLLRRVELKTRTVVVAEQAVESARSEKSGLEQSLAQLAARDEQLREEIEAMSRRGADRADSPQRQASGEIGVQTRLLRLQLESVEARILELENDLAARRREIRALEEIADEILGVQ